MSSTSDERPGMEGHCKGGRGERQRFILGPILLTVPGTLGLIGGLYAAGLPRIEGLDPTVGALSLALQCLFIAMLPYAAVCLTILNNRLLEGAHDPLAGAESERLAIHCRVMQNHLEQLVWFGICLLALSTLLRPAELHLLPILAGVFCLGRLLYWWGYLREGTLERRYGVQITFSVNIGQLLAVFALLLTRGFVGI